MKKYIKDEVIITAGTPIRYDNKVIISPTEADYLAHGWKEYIEPVHIKTLEEIKADKIKEIEAYDISDNVNSFIVAEGHYWVNKADRVGLMNSTNILKANGVTNATFWLGHTKYIVSCDDLISMLSQLEMYALNCYYTTEAHIAAINAMDNIEDVNSYNITLNYPEKLTFNL
jgi:hypothetical protein